MNKNSSLGCKICIPDKFTAFVILTFTIVASAGNSSYCHTGQAQHFPHINNSSVYICQKKFAYAEMFFQRQFGSNKIVVNGKTVSESLKKSVEQAKYTNDALEIMGQDGWELVTTTARNFDNGFEIYYYFKKETN